MKEAVVYIAESMVKAVGIAGLEAIALRKSILSAWTPLARELGESIVNNCFDFEQGLVFPERADGILSQYRLLMTDDFINAVIGEVEKYTDIAYDRGVDYAYQSIFEGVIKDAEVKKLKKKEKKDRSHLEVLDGGLSPRSDMKNVGKKEIPESVVTDVAAITGASKTNVRRTISRWFKNTQGEYFDRFIVPETARLLSYAQEHEGNISSLRTIGERYKTFVEAEGYWSSISEFDVESSKIFAQVQSLKELHVATYQIEAVLDKKTCAVCLFLNGSKWSVEEAYTKVLDMLVMEAEQAYEVNPFPSRSTPKDFEKPEDSPYGIPPYHPRCRCNIVSSVAVQMAPRRTLGTSEDDGERPTDRQLSIMFGDFVLHADNSEIQALVSSYTRNLQGDVVELGLRRALTQAEYKRVRGAFNDIPYELKKWARQNQDTYKIIAIPADGDDVSRVIGNVIEINEKYLTSKVGPDVIQHELRHALINKAVIKDRGGAKGAEALWEALISDKKTKIPTPIHVNHMYKINRGKAAASAAVDEFMAMVGDFYKPGMSLDELATALRSKELGIEVEKKIGSLSTSLVNSRRWTAAEARRAANLWWEWMDIDNYTLMSKKQLLATVNHKPATGAVQRIALENEKRLKKVLQAAGIEDVSNLGDNEPFDLWIGGRPSAWYSGTSKTKPKYVIEVKTIVRAKNDKITMHKDALARKKWELRLFGKKTTGHTVVFDERTGKLYYREGLGSFRLTAMREVTESELQVIFGGKAQVVEYVEDAAPKYVSITTKKQFKEFQENMQKVRPEHKLFLDWYSWEEYKEKGIRLYMEENGYTGFGITKDNMLVTLWTRADAPKGIGRKSIKYAIEQGVDNLECFDGYLPKLYSQFGFKIEDRFPWNPEYAPEGWDYKKFGTPDYLVMRKGPKGKVVTEASPSAVRLADLEPNAKIKSSDIIKVGVIDEGNVNVVEKVRFKGSEKLWVYKPIKGESYKYQNAFMRNSITNEDVPLALREVMALEIAKRLDLNNSYAIVPDYKIAVSKGGKIQGVLIEFIDDAQVHDKFMEIRGNPKLSGEESYQMSIFDFIIGNTDRHNANYMRRNFDGKPIYIDHGYSFPSSEDSIYKNILGTAELRMLQAQEFTDAHFNDFDLDPDMINSLMVSLEKLIENDDEVMKLMDKFGFDWDEQEAFWNRLNYVYDKMSSGDFWKVIARHSNEFYFQGFRDEDYLVREF